MTITGHKTFAVFQRYNNPSAEDIKEVVLAPAPGFVYKNQAATFPHGAHIAEKVEDAVASVFDFSSLWAGSSVGRAED